MDERELLTLARQLVASLERKLAAKPSAAVTQPSAKQTPLQKKADKLIPGTHSTIKVRTFAKLPKNKQAYITKKQNEYRQIFKRDWGNVPQKDVNKYINEATAESVEYGFLNHPKKLTMAQWKQGTDEAFEKLVEEESDNEE